jgi:hypothetical protein
MDDKAIPKNGSAHSDRNAKLDKAIQGAQAKRRDQLAARPVEGHPMKPRPTLPR